jgi:hypothetical protein
VNLVMTFPYRATVQGDENQADQKNIFSGHKRIIFSQEWFCKISDM